MVVRLAFAVAINTDPQILVVDEALSVGDELFQRKCFSRIEAIRAAGATILFVSHSGGTIVELCDRALLLDGGELLAVGLPKHIVGSYQRLLYAPDEKKATVREDIRQGRVEKADVTTLHVLAGELPDVRCSQSDSREWFDPGLMPTSTISYESQGAMIAGPAIYTLQGEQVNNLVRGRTYRYRYQATFDKSASNIRFGMMVKTLSGIELGGGASAGSARTSLPYVQAGARVWVEFRFDCRLTSGVYFLNAGIVGDVNGSETYLHRLVDVAIFRVLPEAEMLPTGCVDFACQPKIEFA
jgi:lipopolysaccharide transport system ATP-binding protein